MDEQQKSWNPLAALVKEINKKETSGQKEEKYLY